MRCSPKAADSDAGCIGPILFSFATSSASLHLIYVCIDGSLCQAAARCNDSPDNSPLQLALLMLSAHLRQSLSTVQSEQYTCPPKALWASAATCQSHASPLPLPLGHQSPAMLSRPRSRHPWQSVICFTGPSARGSWQTPVIVPWVQGLSC